MNLFITTLIIIIIIRSVHTGVWPRVVFVYICIVPIVTEILQCYL